jgi:uncharacterized protein YcbK (DUF882 family)
MTPTPGPPAWTRRSVVTLPLAAAAALLAPRRRAEAAGAATAAGRLSLYNIHTREALTIPYRDAAGRYDEAAVGQLNRLLRCHFTGEVAAIDLRVVEFLRAVDETLGGDREIHVVSGFRSAAYNAWLIRRGSGVSPHSLHLVGRAIDVRFPGLPVERVRRAAVALGRGGVGCYPASGFVHLDSGRIRSW